MSGFANHANRDAPSRRPDHHRAPTDIRKGATDVGTAAGAVAGLTAGAQGGAWFGPAGAVIGGLGGAAVGAYAGRKATNYAGEKVERGFNHANAAAQRQWNDARNRATRVGVHARDYMERPEKKWDTYGYEVATGGPNNRDGTGPQWGQVSEKHTRKHVEGEKWYSVPQYEKTYRRVGGLRSYNPDAGVKNAVSHLDIDRNANRDIYQSTFRPFRVTNYLRKKGWHKTADWTAKRGWGDRSRPIKRGRKPTKQPTVPEDEQIYM